MAASSVHWTLELLQNASLTYSAPFSALTLRDADDLVGAEGVEAVGESDADVDFGGLAVGVPRHDAFTEGREPSR